jgi:hypothetical protein
LFEAQDRQLAFDQALRTPRLGQDLTDTNAVVPKIGPVRVLPDVGGFHARSFHAAEATRASRMHHGSLPRKSRVSTQNLELNVQV